MENMEMKSEQSPSGVLNYNSATARPTHARYGVVALAVLLGMVTYLDRACISNVNKEMQRDLVISDAQMSVVFSTFTLAYVPV